MTEAAPLHILLVGDAPDLAAALETGLSEGGARLDVEADLPADAAGVEALLQRAAEGLDRMDGVVIAVPPLKGDKSVGNLIDALRGVFLVTREVAKKMVRERAGAVVAVLPAPDAREDDSAYQQAANRAAAGLIQSVARELAGRNIRANAVRCPEGATAEQVADTVRVALTAAALSGQVLTAGLEAPA